MMSTDGCIASNGVLKEYLNNVQLECQKNYENQTWKDFISGLVYQFGRNQPICRPELTWYHDSQYGRNALTQNQISTYKVSGT